MLFVSSKKFKFREANIEVWNWNFYSLIHSIETVGGWCGFNNFCQGFIALILEMGFAVGSTFANQIYFLSIASRIYYICLSLLYDAPCKDNIYR